jgi:hypothetical protein
MNNPLKYTDPSGYSYKPAYWNAGVNGAIYVNYYANSGPTGLIGPGSNNHWSDPYRTQDGHWWLGNEASFDSKYGEGAYMTYAGNYTGQNTTTGNVAEKDFGTVLTWLQEGFNLTIINNTVIGYFGKLGEVRYYPDGAIKVSNPSAGAVSGEAQVTGEQGSILRRANNFNTLLGISLFGIDRTLSFTRMGRDIAYNFAYTSFAKATNFIKPIGYGTSFAGFAIGYAKYKISDKSWGDYGQLGVSFISSALTIHPYTAPIGIVIGGIDLFEGFDGFYNYLDTQQQLYENTGGIMIYTNQFPVFLPISTRP